MAILTAPAVLEARGLTRHFGGLSAVDGVDLQISAGDVVGIAGPNGAGKSTLLDLLSGRQRPSAGEVYLEGEQITRFPPHVRARMGVARSYQAPQTAEGLTVEEIVAAAVIAYGHRVGRDRVQSVFEFFGLDPSSSRLAGALDTLSRRKLLLACGVLRQPKVLLLDEPCSGLLSEEISELEALVRVLCVDGTSFIEPMPAVIIEHRLELLEALSTRTIVMDAGKVIAVGQFHSVFALPEVRKAYFLTEDDPLEAEL